jgi:hypothetical protein
VKTRLIISLDTPKSLMISTGSRLAIASRAAVEDTVAKPRADASATDIGPAAQRTASRSTCP